MILQARAASCWSRALVLKRNDHPIGTCTGRWFSESRDIELTGRRQLVFEKTTWLSQFVLMDTASGRPLGAAESSGWFAKNWNLELSMGPARLVRKGWFWRGYVVEQGDAILARVDPLGLWERGWSVTSDAALPEEDLILIGLVYQTILRRAQHAS